MNYAVCFKSYGMDFHLKNPCSEPMPDHSGFGTYNIAY